MRKQHYLRGNKTSQTIRHIISIDTETIPVVQSDGSTVHLLELGWALYSRRLPSGGWSNPTGIEFTSTAELHQWINSLVKPKNRYICLAHNWSFDAQVLDLFAGLPDQGWTMGLGIIDGPPWAVSWKRGTTRLDMLDTMNWWPTSLASIGENIGLAKGDWNTVNDNTAELSSYCRRDAEIPLRAVQRWGDWLIEEDLGGFSLTAASQAFRAFRHRFMSHDILIDDDERALALARKSYHGGRTECFHIGEINKELTLLDVTSMYPYVMLENTYPTILRGRWKNVELPELDTLLASHCVIADVTLTTTSPAYAVVQDNRLIFPTGTFRTVLTTRELLRALSRRELITCHEASFYAHDPIFTEYISYFYNKRLEAKRSENGFQSQLYKLMMNSLYGKFGQQGICWETIGDSHDEKASTWTVHDIDDGTSVSYRRLGGRIQEKLRDGESRESHPAIAAHVTADARLYLWELIERGGVENVYYTDTDSLLVDSTALARLHDVIHPTRLGSLKIELTTPYARIYGAKDYQFGDKCKTKGVRKNAQWLTTSGIAEWYKSRGLPIINPEALVGSIVEQDQFRSMTGAIRAGEPGVMRITTVRKRLRREYLKGNVGPTGRVTPFRLGRSDAPGAPR